MLPCDCQGKTLLFKSRKFSLKLFQIFSLSELPDMMSALEGEGGSWKSGRKKGLCVKYKSDPIAYKGGWGSKNTQNFVDIISGISLMLL